MNRIISKLIPIFFILAFLKTLFKLMKEFYSAGRKTIQNILLDYKRFTLHLVGKRCKIYRLFMRGFHYILKIYPLSIRGFHYA